MKKTRGKKADGKEAIDRNTAAPTGRPGEAAAPATGVEACPPVDETRADDSGRGVEAAPAPDPVEALQAKVERLEDSLLRAKADYRNLERRSINERAEAIRYGNTDLIKSLLAVVDDFERSMTAMSASKDPAAVIEGVRLIYDNLIQALRTRGLDTIEALHKPFDPSVHEAMMQQPSEEHPPGTVVDVIGKGYRLHDRVLRPAKVVVSTAVKGAGNEESHRQGGETAKEE